MNRKEQNSRYYLKHKEKVKEARRLRYKNKDMLDKKRKMNELRDICKGTEHILNNENRGTEQIEDITYEPCYE